MAKAFKPVGFGPREPDAAEAPPRPGGVIRERAGRAGREWNVLGQTYLPKEITEASFAWHALMPPHTGLPLHVHEEQDEFVYVLEGRLDFVIGGEETYATQFDLVSLPRGVPHSMRNRSRHICKALCWVAPTGGLPDLFEAIHHLPQQRLEDVVALGARHGVTFRE